LETWPYRWYDQEDGEGDDDEDEDDMENDDELGPDADRGEFLKY